MRRSPYYNCNESGNDNQRQSEWKGAVYFVIANLKFKFTSWRFEHTRKMKEKTINLGLIKMKIKKSFKTEINYRYLQKD